MAKESAAQRQKRVLRIIELLHRYYPGAECALHHETPEQLLIATVLSAQCTDERVNKVTPQLFNRYPLMHDLAAAPVGEIEELVKSINFFRSKAKNLKALAGQLVNHHGGRVPEDLEALVRLPGVGRKTANVVLGNSFGLKTGIVVDTHVRRVSRRLGLTANKSPVLIERDLVRLVPETNWIQFSHWLIHHGRQVCKARNPACHTCFLADICPKKMG